jgi:hypothetical protein
MISTSGAEDPALDDAAGRSVTLTGPVIPSDVMITPGIFGMKPFVFWLGLSRIDEFCCCT